MGDYFKNSFSKGKLYHLFFVNCTICSVAFFFSFVTFTYLQMNGKSDTWSILGKTKRLVSLYFMQRHWNVVVIFSTYNSSDLAICFPIAIVYKIRGFHLLQSYK